MGRVVIVAVTCVICPPPPWMQCDYIKNAHSPANKEQNYNSIISITFIHTCGANIIKRKCPILNVQDQLSNETHNNIINYNRNQKKKNGLLSTHVYVCLYIYIYIYISWVCVSVCAYIYIYIYMCVCILNPSTQAGCDTRSIFKWSLTF